MVKHKNSIPKVHCRKHWQKYVKTDFDKQVISSIYKLRYLRHELAQDEHEGTMLFI